MKRALWFVVVMAIVGSCSSPAFAMYRPLRDIVAAIRLSGGRAVNDAQARAWGKVIQDECKAREVDPLTPISMVYFESHWRPRTVYAPDPRYSVGLMSIGAVKKGSSCQSKALIATPGCQAKIALLMDGAHNIRRGMMGISIRRAYCRRITGRPALFARWLSSYQGYDRRRGVTCNQRQDARGRWRDLPIPPKTLRVMRYRLELIRRLGL